MNLFRCLFPKQKIIMVQMNGCMATIRGKVKKGVILKTRTDCDYLTPYLVYICQFEGEEGSRTVFKDSCVKNEDGILEYQY